MMILGWIWFDYPLNNSLGWIEIDYTLFVILGWKEFDYPLKKILKWIKLERGNWMCWGGGVKAGLYRGEIGFVTIVRFA